MNKVGEAATELAGLLVPEQKDTLAQYLYGREVIEFLLAFPQAKFEPQEFVATQKQVLIRPDPLTPRFRSHQ